MGRLYVSKAPTKQSDCFFKKQDHRSCYLPPFQRDDTDGYRCEYKSSTGLPRLLCLSSECQHLRTTGSGDTANGVGLLPWKIGGWALRGALPDTVAPNSTGTRPGWKHDRAALSPFGSLINGRMWWANWRNEVHYVPTMPAGEIRLYGW